MMYSTCKDAADWLWILSTDFGITVFVLTFLTGGLVIVNLILLMLWLVHVLFGKKGALRKQ